jgi:hypothetical protein
VWADSRGEGGGEGGGEGRGGREMGGEGDASAGTWVRPRGHMARVRAFALLQPRGRGFYHVGGR